jgi:hypothetical protein
MSSDNDHRRHKEWLGYLQPMGLVVSPPALASALAFPNANIIPEHTRFLECVREVAVAGSDEKVPAITDFPRFCAYVLGWRPSDLVGSKEGGPLPDALESVLTDYNETLRPTYAVKHPESKPEGQSQWMLLVKVLPDGTPFDDFIETESQHWQVSPQARFERLLRDPHIQVPIGLLFNGTNLRLIYAPKGESSGHLTFPVRAMTEVAGRSIFAALVMLLGEDRLFTLPDGQRLPEILEKSRKFQNLVSTKLAEQVLAALYELLRGFQAADDQRKGELLRQVLQDDPNQVYAGLLTVLLRLVFLLYAEDRGLMSDPQDELYHNYYAITGLFERLRADAGRHADTMDHRFGAWAQPLALFRMVHDGARHDRFAIPARKGYLFNPDKYPFLEGRPPGQTSVAPAPDDDRIQPSRTGRDRITVDPPHVSDGVVFRVLQNLLILDGERLSYRTLDVEQIGSVYETIMGFNLEVAGGRSIAIKPTKPHGAPTTINLEELLAAKPADRAKWLKEQTDQAVTGQAASALKDAKTPEDAVAALERKVAHAATPRIVPGGAMVLQPSDERRRSGSHYTPRSLTEPIVETTFRPILQRLGIGSGELGSGGRRKGESDVGKDPIVSRPEGVAVRDGPGGGVLQGDKVISARGDVRINKPDSPRRGGDTGEHRGGARPGNEEGISPVPSHGAGQSARAGNAPSAQHTSRADARGDIDLHTPDGRSTRPDAQHPPAAPPNPTPQALTPTSCFPPPTPQLPTPNSYPTPEQILDLKVCDPAMGSGAFLVAACRFLADLLVRAWHAHNKVPRDIPPDEDEVLHARRLVAQRCLYGVDKNPMAVDLAKLSLWLATLAQDHPFTFLDHALRAGDSLVGLGRDQITAFNWDASSPKKFLRTQINDRLRRVLDERRAIREAREDAPDLLLRQKLALAEEALNPLRFYGDAVVAAFFARPNDKGRKAYVSELAESLTAYLVNPHKMELRAPLEAARKALLSHQPFSISPFHWEIEFPEVFDRQNPGFDAFVGNPPFAGKNTLVAGHAEGYLDWLKAIHEESHGNADLVAHFFRRAFDLLRREGAFGLIATNTIGQGDTRSTGLRWICTHGGMIYDSIRRKKWPGMAAVVVSVVHVAKGTTAKAYRLDGRDVPIITAYLFHAGGHDDPAALRANAAKSFVGSYVLGMGFTFDDTDAKGVASPIAEMQRLIAKDPRNAERIFPYIGGEEVNDSPTHTHHRYVINFGEITEAEARRWPELMKIVEEKVRPKRLADNRESYRRYWWQYAEKRGDLNIAIRGLERVLVISRHQPNWVMAFMRPNMVFSEATIVITLEQTASLAVLQSRPHEIWARFFASSMKDDMRYTPSDCFETFPFPPNFETNSPLESAGQAYYEFRAALMVRNNAGLTKTYNRFHDPDERSPDILKLRELHAAMDRAVLDAYGWTDLRPTCELLLDYEEDEDEDESGGGRRRKKPWRYRWPDDFRDEVLARLLELNRERAEEERLSGAAERSGKVKMTRAKGKTKKPADDQRSFL